MAAVETPTVWSTAVADSPRVATTNMDAPEWLSRVNQQFPLVFVTLYIAAIAIQGHFQHRDSSKALKAVAVVTFIGLLLVYVASASIATYSTSHQTFEGSYSIYMAVSLIFDCLLMGRLNDLCAPSIHLEDHPSPDSSFLRRTLSALTGAVKSCPPAFCFHLLQGTAVVGLTFQGLHHLGEYLKPQLIGNHFQAVKRLAWYDSALLHFEIAAILELIILSVFMFAVYANLIHRGPKDVTDWNARKPWCALLLAAMIMMVRATCNATLAVLNSAISGQPLVDGSCVIFWMFDVVPLLCSFCLLFGMVSDEGSAGTGADVISTSSEAYRGQARYLDEKIFVISIPKSA